jgi:hypothetical protein
MNAYFYGTDIEINQFDIVLGSETDLNITENKPYVVREINGFDLITVQNDKGEIDIYSTEWFKEYNGKAVSVWS